MTTTEVALVDPAAIDRHADPAAYVIESCERAKVWLAHALEYGGIEQIVEIKSQAEAIRVYTMQKQLGKDAQLSASEIVRRAERGIGAAIRKGQEAGEIAKRGSVGGPGGDRGLDLGRPADLAQVNHVSDLSKMYALADVPDEQFESALDEAKDEGDLSRNNVIRKIRKVEPIRDRPDVLRKTRRIDSNRVMEQTIASIEHARPVGGIYEEIDYTALDRDKLGDWIDSLSESISALRSLKSRLEKESNHVRV